MKEQIILITGATGGLGKILAKKFANKNNTLILIARDKEKMEALKNEFEPLCKKIIIQSADLLNNEDIKKVQELAKEATVLINNMANIAPEIMEVGERSIDEEQNIYKTNVLVPAKLTFAARNGAMLKQKYGRIINIASTSAILDYSGRSSYSCSKAALLKQSKIGNLEISTTHKEKYQDKESAKFMDIFTFCLLPGPIEGKVIDDVILKRAEIKKISVEVMTEKYKKFYRNIESGENEMLNYEVVVNKISELLKPLGLLSVEERKYIQTAYTNFPPYYNQKINEDLSIKKSI